MKIETKRVVFSPEANALRRPQIVLELKNGHIESLKLLTGKSGVAEIAKDTLDELLEIGAEAQRYLEGLNQPG